MQKIIKHSHILGSYIATSAAYSALLAVLFLCAGVSIAHADTTYVVDPYSPNGCGTVCQQLQAYLNGNTQGSTNTGTYTPTGSPYFSAYNGSRGNTNGNVYNPSTASNPNNPYPYQIYNYYQNPNLSGTPSTNQNYSGYNTGYNPYGNTPAYNPYSNRMYVQYSQAGSASPKTPTQSTYGTTSGKGFIRTSGY